MKHRVYLVYLKDEDETINGFSQYTILLHCLQTF